MRDSTKRELELSPAIIATQQTRAAVQTVLSNAESVEIAVRELRSKIETFLKQVAA